jgi:hypothetical protein
VSKTGIQARFLFFKGDKYLLTLNMIGVKLFNGSISKNYWTVLEKGLEKRTKDPCAHLRAVPDSSLPEI